MKTSILSLIILTIVFVSCAEEESAAPTVESAPVSAAVQEILNSNAITFTGTNQLIEFQVNPEMSNYLVDEFQMLFANRGLNLDFEKHRIDRSSGRQEGCTTKWTFEEIDCLCGEMLVTVCTDCSGEWECMITFQ